MIKLTQNNDALAQENEGEMLLQDVCELHQGPALVA